MKTDSQLRRMKVSDLAKYLSLEIGLVECDCYHYEGGPLLKEQLLRNAASYRAAKQEPA